MRVIVDSVSVRIRQRRILDAFTATFETGAVTALVGPSGSGKSTLLAVIAGHVEADAGDVWFEDDGRRHRADAADVSWISQDPHILAGRTVLDNVMIGPLCDGLDRSKSVMRSREALRDVGLGDREKATCRDLSGGERQRVVIARSLASTRRLIIADEPSSGLDADNTRVIADLFAAVQGRATVIVATHDPVMMSAAGAVVRLR